MPVLDFASTQGREGQTVAHEPLSIFFLSQAANRLTLMTQDGKACPVCDGTGRQQVTDGYDRCWFCTGRGLGD